MCDKIALAVTRDPLTAEEICQETFAIAFEKLHQLRDPDKTGAWLSAILLNIARGAYNQKKRLLPMESGLLAIQGLQHDPWLEMSFDSLVAVLDLQNAMKTLPMEFLEIIILKYYEDMEVEEIATQLNIPEGTVKSRLSRARGKLRRILEGTEQSDKGGVGSAN
ncbi:MAG: RNA polymerase sigma factor [Bacillota bacterium]